MGRMLTLRRGSRSGGSGCAWVWVEGGDLLYRVGVRVPPPRRAISSLGPVCVVQRDVVFCSFAVRASKPATISSSSDVMDICLSR